MIWLSLAVFTADSLRHRRRRQLRVEPAEQVAA
jgi:hypothetical protein